MPTIIRNAETRDLSLIERLFECPPCPKDKGLKI